MGKEVMNWDEWPEVPLEQRPKRLPHNLSIGPEDLQALSEKGWAPVDVRLLPNGSDAERAEGLKSYFEGLRLGTIQVKQAIARYVEVEARVLGLTSGKKPSESDGKSKGYDGMDFRQLQSRIGGKTGHSEDGKLAFKEKYT